MIGWFATAIIKTVDWQQNVTPGTDNFMIGLFYVNTSSTIPKLLSCSLNRKNLTSFSYCTNDYINKNIILYIFNIFVKNGDQIVLRLFVTTLITFTHCRLFSYWPEFTNIAQNSSFMVHRSHFWEYDSIYCATSHKTISGRLEAL